jgi:hypothetical protein
MPIEFTKKEKKQIKEIGLPILEKLREKLIEEGDASCWIEEVRSVKGSLSAYIDEDSENE